MHHGNLLRLRVGRDVLLHDWIGEGGGQRGEMQDDINLWHQCVKLPSVAAD